MRDVGVSSGRTAGGPGLELRWLPVRDERGRTSMEGVWIRPLSRPGAHQAA